MRNLPDGSVVQVLPDGSTIPYIDPHPTDWVRLEAMTEDEIDANALARHGLPIDGNTLQIEKFGIAQAIFDRKLHALLDILEAAKGIELLQQHTGNK